MRRLLALACAAGVAACGLLSSDLTRVQVRFPERDFRLDTADWAIVGPGQLPSIECSRGCEESRELLCGADRCAAACDNATRTCQLWITILVFNDFDLAREAPGLEELADQPVISVTVDRIFFDIDENTLTVSTPRLYVHALPISGDGGGLVGIIDPLPPGTTGRADVRFEGQGREVLKRFLDDFRTPFRIAVTGAQAVYAGDDLPMGRLVGSVQADASAGL
jgi:hypothetical protein